MIGFCFFLAGCDYSGRIQRTRFGYGKVMEAPMFLSTSQLYVAKVSYGENETLPALTGMSNLRVGDVVVIEKFEPKTYFGGDAIFIVGLADKEELKK